MTIEVGAFGVRILGYLLISLLVSFIFGEAVVLTYMSTPSTMVSRGIVVPKLRLLRWLHFSTFLYPSTSKYLVLQRRFFDVDFV